MYKLRPEKSQDIYEVEALYDLCFAPGREALSSYRLRDEIEPVTNLCHVARDEDGTLAGAIRYWPVRIGDAAGLLLGPIAVHPTRQGEGLASLLVRETLAIAAEKGWLRVMLVGDAPYYARFGFFRLQNVQMPPPTNPDRVLGRALAENAWDGTSGVVRRWDEH